MDIPKLEKELNYISRLGNYPNTDNGLTPEELKQRFDQAGLDIQEYLNGTLVPALENELGSKDSSLHVTVLDGNKVDYTAAEIYELLQDENTACHVYLDRDGKFFPLSRISESLAVFEELVYNSAATAEEEHFFLTRWSFGNDHTLVLDELYIPLGGSGDNALHVYVTENTLDGSRSVNLTAAEIHERMQDEEDACHVYLNWAGRIIPITKISPNKAVFEEFIYREETEDQRESCVLTRWYFGNDYVLHCDEHLITLGGGGDNALHVVIATNDKGEKFVNYTAEEIYNRLQDEGNACHVYLDWCGYLYQLARISQNEAVFEECIFYEEEVDTPRCFRLTRYYFGNDYQLHLYEQRIDFDGDSIEAPVRGVDYWTEEDKAEIKSYVDEAILGGAW